MQQPVPPMPRQFPRLIRRRSALAAGAVATLAPLLPSAALAEPANPMQRTALCGRVLGAGGHPVRGAAVIVGPARTRTDGDGRFFTEVEMPADGPLALQVLPEGGARTLRLLADVERCHTGDRRCASVALSLAV